MPFSQEILSRMEKPVLFCGQLVREAVPIKDGCWFVVAEHEIGNDTHDHTVKVLVTIFSPFRGHEVVDTDIIERREVCSWLEARRDY